MASFQYQGHKSFESLFKRDMCEGYKSQWRMFGEYTVYFMGAEN